MTGRRIRKHYEWNQAVYADKTYVDAISGATFCLKHMSTVVLPFKYEFKDDGEKYKGIVDIKVIFDPHCYTSIKTSHDSRDTLVTDYFSDGTKVERALDRKRYEYSFELLRVISGLSHKWCRESRIIGKAIRLEARSKSNPKSGVYILMKLRSKPEIIS